MILYTPPGVIFRLVHPRAQLKTRSLIIITKILFKYPVLLFTPIYLLCYNQGQDYGGPKRASTMEQKVKAKTFESVYEQVLSEKNRVIRIYEFLLKLSENVFIRQICPQLS